MVQSGQIEQGERMADNRAYQPPSPHDLGYLQGRLSALEDRVNREADVMREQLALIFQKLDEVQKAVAASGGMARLFQAAVPILVVLVPLALIGFLAAHR